ncbi:hypothetical protein N9137_00895 [Pseudomonadales bacterium]|nr:hypothetical protein [Pseudomonadales bacterium]
MKTSRIHKLNKALVSGGASGELTGKATYFVGSEQSRLVYKDGEFIVDEYIRGRVIINGEKLETLLKFLAAALIVAVIIGLVPNPYPVAFLVVHTIVMIWLVFFADRLLETNIDIDARITKKDAEGIWTAVEEFKKEFEDGN